MYLELEFLGAESRREGGRNWEGQGIRNRQKREKQNNLNWESLNCITIAYFTYSMILLISARLRSNRFGHTTSYSTNPYVRKKENFLPFFLSFACVVCIDSVTSV